MLARTVTSFTRTSMTRSITTLANAKSGLNAVLNHFSPNGGTTQSVQASNPALKLVGTRPFTDLELKSAKRAAVLCGLFEHPVDGEINVLLTVRGSGLTSHTGEVALPGGKRDEADQGSDIVTACREAEEEVGLDTKSMNVIGSMDFVLSKHGMIVAPIVSEIPIPSYLTSATTSQTFDVRPSVGEVETVFNCPLRIFLSNTNHRHKDFLWREKTPFRLHFFDYETRDYMMTAKTETHIAHHINEPQNFEIWGMSATILINLAQIVYQTPVEFETGPTTTIKELKEKQSSHL